MRLLPDVVANQVAAGEVVERPAAVVKELVENAIDGMATRIEVDFRRAGKDFISISDNGVGMGREDALLAVQRHATSKIRAIGDLQSLHSFGFRGEALPSIAAVSHFILRSRRSQDSVGTEITIVDGVERAVRECAMEPGTEVRVSHLFQSVPARRKFLCTNQTEANHLIATVRLFAIAFPFIHFQLRHGGHLHLSTAATDSLEVRLRDLLDRTLFPLLLSINAEDGRRKLTGYVLQPDCRAPMGEEMVFFVNRRPIVSRDLRNWVLEAYASYFPGARSLPCFLFLEIPPNQVDVNVHPTKREVRFSRRGELREFFVQSLVDQLARATPSIWPVEVSASAPNLSDVVQSPSFSSTFPSTSTVEIIPSLPVVPVRPPASADLFAPAILSQAIPRTIPIFSPSRGLINWRFVGRLDGNCALWASDTGLIFFDIRAAAMRVAYEKLLREGDNSPRQRLLLPIKLDLRRQEEVGDWLRELIAAGFTMLFSKEEGCHRVTEIPLWLPECSAEAFLYDWLVLQRKTVPKLQMEHFARIAAAHVAASASYKTTADLTTLLWDLMACRIPTTAPDGSGIYFEFSRSEMQRRWAPPGA